MNKLKNELSRISHESQNNKEKYDDDLKSYKEEIEKLKRIIEDKDVYIIMIIIIINRMKMKIFIRN